VAYRHACFLSYVQGEGPLMKGFMDELTTALRSELEPFVDEDVFVDRSHIGPGIDLENAIGTALCQSASWVVVYVPRYTLHPWCRRELKAMLELETARKRILGVALPSEWRMCIPVILRGTPEMLPTELQGPLALDFSRYSVADSRILRNRGYVSRLMDTATHISNLCRLADAATAELTSQCSEFRLPVDDPPGPPPPPQLPTRT